MNRVAWDQPHLHRLLVGLTFHRARFRMGRIVERLRSPRRLIATTLAVGFFGIYLLNGLFVVSNRAPADPDRLRLWLSGGMVIYAFYHAVRCAWSAKVVDLELSAAERLWLGGGPIHRSSLAIYHLNNIVVASLLKTLLLVLLLARDVAYPALLFLGILVALVLLETVRLIIERAVSGLDGRRCALVRGAATLVAAAVTFQVLARIAALTPGDAPVWAYVMNGFRGLGETAASSFIQTLALPWLPAAGLAVTEQLSWATVVQLLAAMGLVPMGIVFLVHADRWAGRQREQRERERLATHANRVDANGRFSSTAISASKTALAPRSAEAPRPTSHAPRPTATRPGTTEILSWLSPEWIGSGVLFVRQLLTVRRYAGSVVFSFVVPMMLSLSPLATGRVGQQWFFIVGGIAMCTLLLAPPALRIDFRRDLKRMLLLRSLPIRPFPMAVGQLLLPVLITIAFQATTLGIAAWVLRPGAAQVLLWSGMLSALAVFTFAMENALFLAYPHHERSEGVTMMVRAKLTFLGKMVLIAFALGGLLAWAALCRNVFPDVLATGTYVSGAILFTWSIALAGIAAVACCWKRFDIAADVPPE